MHRAVKAALLAGALSVLPCAAAQAGTSDYVQDRVIVKFTPGTSTSVKHTIARAAGALNQVGTVDATGAAVLATAADPALVAGRLNRSVSVQYAEVDRILRAHRDAQRPALRRALRDPQRQRRRPRRP